MKKLIYFLCLTFVMSFSFADILPEPSLIGDPSGDVQDIEVHSNEIQDEVDSQVSNIGDITVEFCNDDIVSKNLSLVLDGGIESEICMNFLNYSNKDVEIKYSFVDGTVTNDSYKSKACANEGEVENFGQYVKQLNEMITIPAGQKVQQKAYIKFPAGLSGMVNGCLTYYVSEKTDDVESEGSTFSILVRKATFIDALVGGHMERNIKLLNQSIDYSFDRSNRILIIPLSFFNSGNVNENISVNGTIKNAFGFESDISLNGKLLSDDTTTIEINVPNIPRYGLSYKINLDMESTGIFDFNESSLPQDMLEPITISAATSVFIFPWIFVIVLGGIIVLVLLIRFLVKHLKFEK